MDSFLPFDSDFDLDCGDLFNGLPGSPRKTAFITQEHCNSTTPYPNGFIARATASSLFVRKNSDDDNATEEFLIKTPVVRTTTSLLLRRVTSDVSCSSPFLDMPFFASPASATKRRFEMLSEADRKLQKLTEAVRDKDRLLVSSKKNAPGDPEQPAFPLHACPWSAANKQGDAVKMGCSVYARMGSTFHKLRLLSDVEESQDVLDEASARNCKRARQSSWKDATVAPHKEETNREEERIKSAVEILNSSSVIADGSAPFALPCTSGNHNSQKYITVDTLARLIRGEFADVVHHYVTIDCRYPYEYNGGHIRGATNLYCADSVDEILSWKVHQTENSLGRTVLIFHCEFSSQRAPTMMRLLRNADRKRNLHCYPCLCYPEIYLLSGGYKVFFEKCPELCEPSAYTPMNHPDFQENLRLCRTRATTWHGSEKLSKHKNSLIF
ncbi:M-phase inducer phosphatase 1-like isoform X2 [Pomacea canaliculata]|uniref:M-phase inducer phosphatase 1-like isoform X2 n=1 Tax=Pomacea canaliculata TaxID=400727 RepID=UPI000D7272C2|nr:M-phase inducer phosphatase 1-like isoform X2 [Pomacea canaliculata]